MRKHFELRSTMRMLVMITVESGKEVPTMLNTTCHGGPNIECLLQQGQNICDKQPLRIRCRNSACADISVMNSLFHNHVGQKISGCSFIYYKPCKHTLTPRKVVNNFHIYIFLFLRQVKNIFVINRF